MPYVFCFKINKVKIHRVITIGTRKNRYEENDRGILWINVREYRSGNQNETIQRSWQHRAHKTKKNKPKTQHNMF